MIIDFSNIKDPYGKINIHCFFNLNDSYLFTPLKVCSRSFVRLSDISNKNIVRVVAADTSYKSYAIVRDPFSRIKSLYIQKLISAVDAKMNGFHHSRSIDDIDISKLQDCQLEIVKLFGRDAFFNKKISFKQFILDGIPNLMNKEHHFYTQNDFIPSYVYSYLKMENNDDIKFAFDLFSSNIIHVNKTLKYENITWDTDMKNVISKHYYDDFCRFDYIYSK